MPVTPSSQADETEPSGSTSQALHRSISTLGTVTYLEHVGLALLSQNPAIEGIYNEWITSLWSGNYCDSSCTITHGDRFIIKDLIKKQMNGQMKNYTK